MAFCINIPGLLEKLNYPINPDEYILFIDSSKTSLKSILMHKSAKHKPVPIAYGTDLKETYDVMKKMLTLVKYNDFKKHW